MLTHEQTSPRNETLRTWVRHYAWIAGDGSLSKMIAPRTGAALSVGLQGSYRVDGIPVPQVALMGIRSRAVRVDIGPVPPVDRVHVSFLPSGFHRLTGCDARLLTDLIASAEDFLPGARLRELTAELRCAATFARRVQALERFLLDLAVPLPLLEESVEALANLTCEQPDSCADGRVVRVPTGRRNMERVFGRVVGVSRRTLTRIARFNLARTAVLGRESGSAPGGAGLTDIGLDAGYYDQAHFNRDFKRFASMPPRAYSVCPAPVAGERRSRPQRSLPARNQAT